MKKLTIPVGSILVITIYFYLEIMLLTNPTKMSWGLLSISLLISAIVSAVIEEKQKEFLIIANIICLVLLGITSII